MRTIGVSASGRVVGEYRSHRKLTAEQVAEMRLMRAQHGTSYKKLGEIFGVSDQNAWQIVTGRIWNKEPVSFKQQAMPEDLDQVAQLAAQGHGHNHIAKALGVTRMSAYRMLKEARKQ